MQHTLHTYQRGGCPTKKFCPSEFRFSGMKCVPCTMPLAANPENKTHDWILRSSAKAESLRMTRLQSVLIFIFILSVSLSVAQENFRYNEEAEQLFQQGIELYEFGSFENAAEAFEQALNINPVHQRTTASYIMAAKSWLQLHEHAQALFLMNNLLKRFPETEYARDRKSVV